MSKKKNKIKTNKNKDKVGNKAEARKGRKKNILEFLKKRKGFSLAIIVLVIAIILLLLIPQFPEANMEEAVYAKQYYEENNLYLEEAIKQLGEEEISKEDVLEDDFLASVIDDMEWLKQRNNELFFSHGNVFLKMASMSIFIDRIGALNSEVTYDFFEPDYEATISQAKETEYVFPQIVDEELYEMLEGNEEKIVRGTFENLSKEYYNWKQQLILNLDKERAYVEAKKIIFFYYEDENLAE
jgi:hypothetical protein